MSTAAATKSKRTAERTAAVLSLQEIGEETKKHAIRVAARLRSALTEIDEAERQSRALWDLVVASKHWTATEIRQAVADGKVNAPELVPEIA